MYKVIIKNLSNEVTNAATFESLEVAQSWFDEHDGKDWQTKDIEENIGTFENHEIKIHSSTHTFEIVDLSSDYDTLLHKCYEERSCAYGSWDFQLDEIFHNGID